MHVLHLRVKLMAVKFNRVHLAVRFKYLRCHVAWFRTNINNAKIAMSFGIKFHGS